MNHYYIARLARRFLLTESYSTYYTSQDSMAEANGEVCPVCIDEDVKYWAIGQCQHPVCYVCSTRMRVLCGKKECPTCRETMEEVRKARYI